MDRITFVRGELRRAYFIPKFGKELVNNLNSKRIKRRQKRKAIAPLGMIKVSLLPTLIVHGTIDQHCPYARVEGICRKDEESRNEKWNFLPLKELLTSSAFHPDLQSRLKGGERRSFINSVI
jgi:hypothetical protein